MYMERKKESNTMVEDRKKPIGLSTDALKRKHRCQKNGKWPTIDFEYIQYIGLL